MNRTHPRLSTAGTIRSAPASDCGCNIGRPGIPELKPQCRFAEPPPNTVCMTLEADCGVRDVTSTDGRQASIEELYIAPTFERALPRSVGGVEAGSLGAPDFSDTRLHPLKD